MSSPPFHPRFNGRNNVTVPVRLSLLVDQGSIIDTHLSLNHSLDIRLRREAGVGTVAGMKKRNTILLGSAALAMSIGVAPLSTATAATTEAPITRPVPGVDFTGYVPGTVLSGESGACAWSTHWQTGSCVPVRTPTIQRNDLDTSGPHYLRFLCPADHPYPFQAAFSGNPWWLDDSKHGDMDMKPVEDHGEKRADLSYAGAGTDDPGYVTGIALSWEWNDNRDQAFSGIYQCADMPATW